MTNPLLLVDSDAFTLLAAADLLEPLAEALAIDPAGIRRLPALPHQLDRGRRLRKQYDAGALARARTACERYPAVPGIPTDLDRLARLNQVSHLDEGEALLFALLCEHPSWLLTTGDKRAVIALGTAAELQDIRDQLRGRVLPLEATLIRLVHHLGAKMLGERLQPLATAHMTVEILFGFKEAFDDAECLRQLDSYLRDLIAQAGGNLLSPPDA